MATITPTKPRGGGRSRTPRVPSDAARLRGTATAWLQHPLASFYLVAVPAALLLGLGTIMVWSASSVFAYAQFGDAYYFIERQVMWVGVGLVAVFVTQKVRIDALKRLGWAAFLGTGLLMVLTFIEPFKYCVKGNCNWINLSSNSMLRLQPSEFAKIAIILWAATLFTAKRKVLAEPRHLLIPFVPGAALLVGLTMLQHDLGTAIVMGMVVVGLLWCVGASWRIMAGIGGLAAVGAMALAVLEPARMRRILGFLNPALDPQGANFQPNQAQLGMASGGWWGVGIGGSRQKWGSLSEAHTDYVLAIIGEELGVLGSLLVIGLLLLLGYAGFRIALRSGTFYARMVAAGITCWLMAQAMINVFVVLRLLPVLGVTLPLVSYGGSSLVVNLIAVGILLACAREEPEARAFLDRQRAARQPRARLSAVLPVIRRR